MALEQFFSQGTLLKVEDIDFLDTTDYQVYITGVVDMVGDLNRYAVGRAMVCDFASVQICSTLVDELHGDLEGYVDVHGVSVYALSFDQ